MRDLEYCQMTVACRLLSMIHGMSMVSPSLTVYWGTTLFEFVFDNVSFRREYLPSYCCCCC